MYEVAPSSLHSRYLAPQKSSRPFRVRLSHPVGPFRVEMAACSDELLSHPLSSTWDETQTTSAIPVFNYRPFTAAHSLKVQIVPFRIA
jgi:hypothetical protein